MSDTFFLSWLKIVLTRSWLKSVVFHSLWHYRVYQEKEWLAKIKCRIRIFANSNIYMIFLRGSLMLIHSAYLHGFIRFPCLKTSQNKKGVECPRLDLTFKTLPTLISVKNNCSSINHCASSSFFRILIKINYC